MKNIYNILLYCFLFLSITNAQQIAAYEQIDTIRVSNFPDSKIFLIKVDTTEITSKYNLRYLIAHIEITDLNKDSLIQTISDTSEMNYAAGGVEYVDINLDGYLDLDLNLGLINLIPLHSFYLYNQFKDEYYYSPDFSQLNDYEIDVDKKEIESYSQSTGGRGGYRAKYKIKNDNLFLIEDENSNYYDYEHQKVINNVLRTDSLVETDWVHSTAVLDTYTLVNDSLLLTEKSWLTGVAAPYPADIEENHLYNCGSWGGCMKYLKKEIYFYGNRNKSYTIKDTLRYQVINNKWQKIKTFNK
jgi:hypothetical protein